MTLIEENIIEIAWVHQKLCMNHEYRNTNFDSLDAKSEIIMLAKIFEQEHKKEEWETEDYYIAIEDFAEQRLKEWNESGFIHIYDELTGNFIGGAYDTDRF